ncbi:hypothetical protein [Leifsonia sp. NPDC058230]|uniref:hypothetical protein n=1 Tax=Leifsonia sp. NPDC058230 TaxID=3346391 RepID=UPI0036DE5FF0
MTSLPRDPDSARRTRAARVDFITEESVYGTILVSGMVVAVGSYGASSWQVFLSVFGTVVVFWAAHVYAGTIAGHGVFEGDDTTLGTAFRRAVRRSAGFLTSALPPSIILLIGALEIVPDLVAIWAALWLGVLILAILGYAVFALRGKHWTICALGALGTAAFGLAMIFLKAVIH